MTIIQKVLAIILALTLAFGAGFMKGRDYEKLNGLKEKVVQIVEVVKDNKAAQNVADDVSKKTEDRQEKVRTVYKTIIQKEIEYVKNDPTSSTVLPVSFVRLYNSASAACDLAEPSCQLISEPTQDIAHSDLIHQYNQVGGLYQTCKIALDGYEDFYQGVRAKINKGETINEKD